MKCRKLGVFLGGGDREKGGHLHLQACSGGVWAGVFTRGHPWTDGDHAKLSSGGGGGLTAPGIQLQLSAVWNTELWSVSCADS